MDSAHLTIDRPFVAEGADSQHRGWPVDVVVVVVLVVGWWVCLWGPVRAVAPLAGLMQMKVGQSVFITNNTPYGIVIEAGHSDQAPRGVVLVTVLSVVKRARRGMGGFIKRSLK